MQECFADEIAIDFPSVDLVVDRMRDAFLGERADADVVLTDVSLSREDAWRGVVMPVEVPIRGTCERCLGSGESLIRYAVRLTVPARIADGARIRFRVVSPHAAPVRVEVRIAIRSAA